jgi:hypothetical protein
MAPNRADLNFAFTEYWAVKANQRETAIASGSTAEGTSIATRGGKHFQPLVNLLAGFFLDAGYPVESIGASGSLVTLPGYYRPTKDWDLVVVHRGVLVAAIELKALGGPSYGNNYNNRVEEALGNSVDLSRARVADLLGDEAPWLGYFFVMEDGDGSRKPGSLTSRSKSFPPDPIWAGRSYQDRFVVTGERLLEEKHYDAVCYLVSSPDAPIPQEPSRLLNWEHFSAAIEARLHYLGSLGYP